MSPEQITNPAKAEGLQDMLASAGYSETAISYYIRKPYMGSIPDADQVSDMTGSCGDTMSIYLKLDGDIVTDAKYQVMGCAGAVSAAMAAVDLIRGKTLDYARSLNDGDVFKVLQKIPEKKHHCIQLAVKTLHKALDEYKNGGCRDRNPH
ncbi:iron-sulfur cluster assembly scaffold protein [Desulfonema ishimotonii]|uniref:Iron-sulfur cluster assembly scaffold protein n=1 Tax=Desulfonema ishimotonii TaxID=45657 RepID=A0A401FRT1_9BACT|nr:iron-sulfur cluster assembly scaffold protein [Desulfonema ishimotonii]GBC59674.1 iron-sulfur cluster assembly scaffold protein [Desulfonema ishimotonii]